jgi:F0F1-type ATP synthase assembly protein I
MIVIAVLGVLVAAVGATLYGHKAGISAAIGAAIAMANLYALAHIVRALTTPGASSSAAGWTFAFMLKIVVLLAGVWLLLRAGVVTLLPLIVGYMTLIVGLGVGNLVSNEQPKAPPT